MSDTSDTTNTVDPSAPQSTTPDDDAATDNSSTNAADNISTDAGTADASSSETASTTTSSSGADSGDATAAPAGATPTADDPGQPYLFVDLYSGDDGRLTGGKPDWVTLAATPTYFGAIIKAFDGVSFNDGGWFARHWPAIRAAGGDNYGKRWFRGAYHFLEFLRDGAAQADAYLAAVDAAGGWDTGDILPIIDVEQGRRHPPQSPGQQTAGDRLRHRLRQPDPRGHRPARDPLRSRRHARPWHQRQDGM